MKCRWEAETLHDEFFFFKKRLDEMVLVAQMMERKFHRAFNFLQMYRTCNLGFRDMNVT